jgi:hypothetical protein
MGIDPAEETKHPHYWRSVLSLLDSQAEPKIGVVGGEG